MTETIETRRTEAEAKLGKLRSARGAATLDGKEFDVAELNALESELASLDAADGEQVRRERAEAQKEFATRRAEMRKELAGLEATRLGEIQDMNSAARTLAETIGKNFDTVRQMSEVAHAISSESAPIPLQAPAVALRLSARLSAVMGGITGHRHRLGHIAWEGSSLYREADDWRALEAALMERHLKPLIEKDTDNGKS
jgi:hypothetical protein